MSLIFRWLLNRTRFHPWECDSCGGLLLADEDVPLAFCPYCGTVA